MKNPAATPIPFPYGSLPYFSRHPLSAMARSRPLAMSTDVTRNSLMSSEFA